MADRNWTHQTIWSGAPPSANVNWASDFATNNTYSAMMRLVSSGAQNDSVSWPLALGAGTYDIDVIHRKDDNRGIYTVELGGVAAGTFDGYAAAAAEVVSTLAGVVIPNLLTSTTVKFTMATKNGSSSAYFGVIEAVTIRRVA